jgi:hypothetical protein
VSVADLVTRILLATKGEVEEVIVVGGSLVEIVKCVLMVAGLIVEPG